MSFVQTIGQNHRNSTNNTSFVTVPVGGVAQGNTVIVFLGWNSTSNDPTGITDTQGNTYTQDASATNATTSSKKITVWSAPVTTALVSGDTITATWASGPSRITIQAVEVTNILTSSPVDVTANNTSASSATIDAGSVATTVATEFWAMTGLQSIGASTTFTLTADGAFTALTTESTNAGSTNIGMSAEWKEVTSTGTMHPAPTSSITSSYAACCVAYKQLLGTPVNTVAPAVTGNKYTGQTLTSTSGTWTGNATITFGYQWQRAGVDIGGATASTHVLVSGDEGQSITCVVTGTNGVGASSATSNAIVGGKSYVATTALGCEFCEFAFVSYTAGLIVLAPPITVVRIAPGSSASDRDPAWSDVSDLVRAFTYTRGRQTELDDAEVGTASVVFDNRSRVLDPSYRAGPFYGRLLPNMQISIQASYGTLVYDLFRGYVERFTTAYTGPNYAETTMECVDGLASLNGVTITGTFDEELTGSRITGILGAAGWPTSTPPTTGWTLDTDTLGLTTELAAFVPVNGVDAGRATVVTSTFLDTDNKTALDHIHEVARSEPGRFFFDGSGVGVFQDRTHLLPVPDDPVLTLTDDPTDPTAISYRDVTPNYEIDKIKNDIRLAAADGSVAEYLDTVSFDRYWRRTLNRQTLLGGSDNDLWQQAAWLLFQNKEPSLRILRVVVTAFDTLTFRALHPLEIGDVVTILRTPPGDTSEQIQQDSAIERLTVTASPGPTWTFSYELSPIIRQIQARWVLDASALDIDTNLIYE